MTAYAEIVKSLNQATELIAAFPSAKEQEDLRRPLGAIMQTVWLDLMLPIVREYPDLDPDKAPSP